MQLRARHRLGKFLLRHDRRPTGCGKAWTKKYLQWIKIHVRFDQPALEATLAQGSDPELLLHCAHDWSSLRTASRRSRSLAASPPGFPHSRSLNTPYFP